MTREETIKAARRVLRETETGSELEQICKAILEHLTRDERRDRLDRMVVVLALAKHSMPQQLVAEAKAYLAAIDAEFDNKAGGDCTT